jgi:LPXTG-motif cell wall-anchored protein
MTNIKRNGFLISMVLFGGLVPTICLAVPAKPEGSPFSNTNNSSPTYNGANSLTSDSTIENKTYTSDVGSQNVLLVSGGTSTLNTCIFNKTGDSSDENADFYGTNAGIMVYNGATLNINNATITTNGGHANAVFAYGTGIINIKDSNIKTSSNNSGGVMVTGGGTLTANNVTVSTSGNSSAAIRSDRGGGTLTVNNGNYSTSGVGSPAIYSTAAITVNNATLTSSSSEGAIVEGANSINLNNVTLTDTNTTLNGNSETYKNIFLYQSMSGDATSGNATFTAKDSTIKTNKGDSIFVTNTTAIINLENNTFANSDGDFLRIQTGKWGNSGTNGGNVTLNMTNQKIDGNIIVDSISNLTLSLTSKSVFKGAIDAENKAKKIDLSLTKDSVMVLSDDTYVDTLTNELTDNSNIYLNGHSLYVNGNKVNANNGVYKEDVTNTNVSTNNTSNKNNNMYLYIGIGAGLILLIIVLLIMKKRKDKYRKMNA